jgi:hypothetical protein
MKQLFRKIKGKPVTADADQRAVYLAQLILKVQNSWAVWMQRQSEKLPGKMKVYVLLLFCVVSAGVSTLLTYRGVRGKPAQFRVAAIRIPVIPKQRSPPGLDRNEVKNILRFGKYMDSLSKDAHGKRTYDSIMAARPGLMDSVLFIEKTYNRELNKR